MALVSDADIDTLLRTYLIDLPLLEKLDRYAHGDQDPPFMPAHANAEYRLVAGRSFTNFMGQTLNIPTQTLFVDGFRTSRGGSEPAMAADGPEWEAWQRSRGDSIQSAIYRGAFTHGYSLVSAARDKKTGKSRIRGISALRSSAIFDDPVNDIVPLAAIEIKQDAEERWVNGNAVRIPGKAVVWGETHEEYITWDNKDGKRSFTRISSRPHGGSECPVTRFPASIDLEGRCIGIVEPLIQLQDRINQSVHDLLIAQTYTAHQVRTATGMAGAVQKDFIFEKDSDGNIVYDEDGHPEIREVRDKIGPDGQPVLEQPNINAASMLISEDPQAKFGVLPGAPLDGFIESINMSVRHFATLSATPPHYMMGSITNISADALKSAEMALTRKIDLYKVIFGECWERVINVCAEIDGAPTHDEKLETLWRDMEGQSLARTADALLKLKELNVPAQALWSMVPGMTSTQLKEWKELIEDNPDEILANAMVKGAESVRPDGRQPTDPNQEQTPADPDLE